MAIPKRSGFKGIFKITPLAAQYLMRIEAVKQSIEALPITPRLLFHLRETARLFSTHYSTLIEGNLLTHEQVAQVIVDHRHFPGRDRDESEVRGYYAGLDEEERLATLRAELPKPSIRKLHALVMGSGKTRVKPTPYRDGQNVIKDSGSRKIVYMPPQATDVPSLMGDLVAWIARRTDCRVPFGRPSRTINSRRFIRTMTAMEERRVW